MLTKEQYETIFTTVAKRSAKNEVYAHTEHKLLLGLIQDLKPVVDYLTGASPEIPNFQNTAKVNDAKYVTIKEKMQGYSEFSNVSKIQRGDVIAVQYQSKTRPGIVVRIKDGMVYCLLISSEIDSPYKLIKNDSRFFPSGVITHTLVPIEEKKALDLMIGVYGNAKHVGQAIRLYKQKMDKLFRRY